MDTSSACETLLLTSGSNHLRRELVKAWPSLSNKPSQSAPSPLLPKSLYLGQPCRRVDHRLSPIAASRRPATRDQLRKRFAGCQAEQLRSLPIGCEPGSQHVCRSHLQGSLNYQTTTLMPVVFGKLQLWRAAYHAAFPSSYLQHEAWLARAASAPHVGNLSRRPCCSIVSASAGAPSRWYDESSVADQPCYPWRLPGSVELGLRLGST